MLSACGKAVYKLWIRHGQLPTLTTLPTVRRLAVVNCTFDMPFLTTVFKQAGSFFTQLLLTNRSDAGMFLCTLTTGPITTNKLIKE
jgi:hypothetical protein